MGWLQIVTGDRERGLDRIRTWFLEDPEHVSKHNLVDWTSALLRSANPPDGLAEILELLKSLEQAKVTHASDTDQV